MGLDTSHGAWHGSYIAFDDWRYTIAQLAGYPPLDEMDGYFGTRGWDDLPTTADQRLVPLLDDSDWDGELSPEQCAQIADGLNAIVKLTGEWEPETHQFIAGCREAAAANEVMNFY